MINVCYVGGHIETLPQDEVMADGLTTPSDAGDCRNIFAKDLNGDGEADW